MHAVQLRKSQNYYIQFNKMVHVSYYNPWLIVGLKLCWYVYMNKYAYLAEHNRMGDKVYYAM